MHKQKPLTELIAVFARLGRAGWRLGWHEGQAGNLSCLLDESLAAGVRRANWRDVGNWVPLATALPKLTSALVLVTASGARLGRAGLADGTVSVPGIIELDGSGSAWRTIGGFSHGVGPTSELAAHLAAYAARRDTKGRAGAGVHAGPASTRFVYHAHPESAIVLSHLASDSAAYTKSLQDALLECAVSIPEGVALLEPMEPGSPQLAAATGAALRTSRVVVWARHGVLVAADGPDEAFDLVHMVEKAASICLRATVARASSRET